MSLAYDKFDDIRVYQNEYVTDNVVNRCLDRLLANDIKLNTLFESLSGNNAVFTTAPVTSDDIGQAHQIAVSNGYLYVYAPHNGKNWGRFALDYSW